MSAMLRRSSRRLRPARRWKRSGADPRPLRQAVERNFEIIGEAVGRLAAIDPANRRRIGDHPQIIAFRNVLIHGYDLIDDAQVWRVITSDLPRLEQQVSEILSEHAP